MSAHAFALLDELHAASRKRQRHFLCDRPPALFDCTQAGLPLSTALSMCTSTLPLHVMDPLVACNMTGRPPWLVLSPHFMFHRLHTR